MKKIKLTLTILGSLALLLPSCNTMVGLGQDVKRLGEGMENTARQKNLSAGQDQPSNYYAPPSTQYTGQ